MRYVILENRTKKPPKMLVFNLDINIFSVKIENKITVKGSDGKERKKRTTKRAPDSLRIPAKGRTEPLPEKILHCKKIKEAIQNREIVVLEAKDYNVPKEEVEICKPKVRSKKG